MKAPASLHVPEPADVAAVGRVFARAMADDPLNVFIYPDPRARARALSALYEMIARVGLRSGMLHASSASIEGVALWDFPGERGFTASAMLGAGALRFMVRAGFSRAMRMGRYEAWAHELLGKHAPPRSAHLLLLSVDPAQQGRGWAGRLLRPVLGQLDAQQVPCCLETQNPANLPFYEHLGFGVVRRARVPGSEVGHWVMVRSAPGTIPPTAASLRSVPPPSPPC